MTQQLIHTVRYVGGAGYGESRWIRLEQEMTDEAVTVEEAAEMIDAIYGVDTCEQGIGNGGQAEAAAPEEEQFDEAVSALLGDDICAQAEYWTAYVRVYRSHQSPDYVLRSETATVESVEPGIRESVREIIETPGNSHDLELPFAGDLVLPPGVRGEVRGSTLNLSRPATGPLVVRYTTVYDRVTLHVPVSAEASSRGADEDQAARAALDAAGLIAFQGDGVRAVAAAVALTPPAQDERVSAAELASLCGRRARYRRRGGDCWQVVEHYSKCTCTDRDAPGHEWEERPAVPCPDGVAAGSYTGTVRKLDAYVMCPEDIDPEMRDPAFYRRTCCHPVPLGKQLPGCRRYYEIWRGGEQIENGPDYWREIYGSDVRLVAVSPPDGICGQKITEWQINKQNCCDDIIPLSPRPDNPTEISPGRSYNIGVLNGRPDDITWRLFGGLEFPDGTTTAHGPGLTGAIVRARDSICPQPRITVDDGCDPLTMTFVGQASEPLHLSSEDEVIYSNTQFYVQAVGGVPPYMWIIGGGIILRGFSLDGSIAYLQTKGTDEWCVEDITVSDQCGTTATCTVRNASTGVWANWPWDDGCASPTGEMFPKDPSAAQSAFSLPSRGYRIRTVPTDWSSCNYTPQPRTCPPGTWFTTGEKARFERQCTGWGGELGDDGCCRNPITERALVSRGEWIAAVQKWICHD